LIFIRFSKRLGALSTGDPSQSRWSGKTKPIVGGLSFYIVFLLAGLVQFLVGYPLQSDKAAFLALLTIGTLGFLVGLVDDAYTTKPLLKFIGQLVCGILVVGFGYGIHLFNNWFIDSIITCIWVVGIMNSINMLDNMDGITGSVSLGILISTLMVCAVLAGDWKTSLFFGLTIGMSGAILGFLVLNWYPSKLYMGDTGSQFLGAFLAFYGIMFFWNLPDIHGQLIFTRRILFPIMIFLMPIMDTTFVTVARLRRGQSPFIGGKDHTTHHLSYIGVPQSIIPLITGMVSVVSGVLVLLAITTLRGWDHFYTFILCAYITGMVSVFIYLYEKGSKIYKAKQQARQVAADTNTILPSVPVVVKADHRSNRLVRTTP
jgi:UDP-GlcNAc:undecaprenyl-phosphate GlcNAc-1-phosphate transferase